MKCRIGYRPSSIVHRLFSCFTLALVLLTGCVLPKAVSEPAARLTLSQTLGQPADPGFARALEPRPFLFPQDHGPHPEFAAEWWYYTGNLEAKNGRRYGFQLTFFRFGLTPKPAERRSAWATSNIYMAHFALSEIGAGRFTAFERLSRGGAGLAGSQADPFRVWLDDWSADGPGPDGTPMRLRAAQDGLAIDLTLQAGKPPVLQGDRGLSQKSAEPGNASYYYSLTRMPIEGRIRTADGEAQVTGLGWMDREWSTSALAADQVGWDWFALQLDDGRELMYYRMRLRDGSDDPYSSGVFVAQDGIGTRLRREDVRLEATGTWQSRHSGATYPSGWRLQIPGESLDLQIAPAIQDQELPLTLAYWEGAVQITGTTEGTPISGRGYVELTGYADRGGGELRVRGE
jgi:predicted secreted hydrolase